MSSRGFAATPAREGSTNDTHDAIHPLETFAPAPALTMHNMDVGTVVKVALVRWPDDSDRLGHLRLLAQPRLLLITPDVDPPTCPDVLEDWVRTPVDPRDLEARVSALELRAARALPPRLDANSCLHAGSRWVALTPIESRLVKLLLERFGLVVSRGALVGAAWPKRKPTNNQLDLHMMRLRRRLEPLGLALRTVRARGYSLDRSFVHGRPSTGAH